MSKKIVNSVVGLFGSLGTIPFIKEIIVFIISMCPILELRGGLIAASLLHLNPIVSYIVCFLGNVLPIPFILWFISKILNWMRNSKKVKIKNITIIKDLYLFITSPNKLYVFIPKYYSS